MPIKEVEIQELIEALYETGLEGEEETARMLYRAAFTLMKRDLMIKATYDEEQRNAEAERRLNSLLGAHFAKDFLERSEFEDEPDDVDGPPVGYTA